MNSLITGLTKILTMKSILLIVTFLIFLGCGTDQGSGKEYIYSLKNESGKSIVIKSYTTISRDANPSITTLEDGEEITKRFQDALPPSGYNFSDFFGEDSQKDSIKVIYDNAKSEIFIQIGCIGSSRNPLNFCVYNGTQEIFIFTEEDYENATPCDGDCE